MAQLDTIWPALVDEVHDLIMALTPRLKGRDLYTYRDWEHKDGKRFQQVTGTPRLFTISPPRRRRNVSRGTGTTQTDYEADLLVWYPEGGLWPLAMEDDWEHIASTIDSNQTDEVTGVCFKIVERDVVRTLTQPSDDGKWILRTVPLLVRLALS